MLPPASKVLRSAVCFTRYRLCEILEYSNKVAEMVEERNKAVRKNKNYEGALREKDLQLTLAQKRQQQDQSHINALETRNKKLKKENLKALLKK